MSLNIDGLSVWSLKKCLKAVYGRLLCHVHQNRPILAVFIMFEAVNCNREIVANIPWLCSVSHQGQLQVKMKFLAERDNWVAF